MGRGQLGALEAAHPDGTTCPQPNQGDLLPRPSFLYRTIRDLGIGTFRDLAVVLETAPILTALDIFVDRHVSALPVINEDGTHARIGLGGAGAHEGQRSMWHPLRAQGRVWVRSLCLL